MKVLLMIAFTANQVLAQYEGSSFNQVKDMLFDKIAAPTVAAEKAEWDIYQKGKLPQYEVTAASFIVNGVDKLLESAKRTVSENEDFYPRITKLLHSNGACVTGEWNITEKNTYSGYFSQGAKGLFVGRWSVALTETLRGQQRGFGFAGKIFPTLNPDQVVKTANFFSVDVLMGTDAKSPFAVSTTNEPELGFNWSLISLGLKISNTLTKADQSPMFRPLYPISELGVSKGEGVHTPKWIKLEPRFKGDVPTVQDFRDEIKSFPAGLEMAIYVSDTSKDRNNKAAWKYLGAITVRESVVSYGCDRRLHFAHPKIK